MQDTESGENCVVKQIEAALSSEERMRLSRWNGDDVYGRPKSPELGVKQQLLRALRAFHKVI